jgi:hypothetical protein
MADVLKDTWPRFTAHWGAATLGVFLRSFLPVAIKWTDANVAATFPRWWVFLLLSCLIAAVSGAINSNLPAKPREILKSIGLGFAINVTALIARISHW